MDFSYASLSAIKAPLFSNNSGFTVQLLPTGKLESERSIAHSLALIRSRFAVCGQTSTRKIAAGKWYRLKLAVSRHTFSAAPSVNLLIGNRWCALFCLVFLIADAPADDDDDLAA